MKRLKGFGASRKKKAKSKSGDLPSKSKPVADASHRPTKSCDRPQSPSSPAELDTRAPASDQTVSPPDDNYETLTDAHKLCVIPKHARKGSGSMGEKDHVVETSDKDQTEAEDKGEGEMSDTDDGEDEEVSSSGKDAVVVDGDEGDEAREEEKPIDDKDDEETIQKEDEDSKDTDDIPPKEDVNGDPINDREDPTTPVDHPNDATTTTSAPSTSRSHLESSSSSSFHLSLDASALARIDSFQHASSVLSTDAEDADDSSEEEPDVEVEYEGEGDAGEGESLSTRAKRISSSGSSPLDLMVVAKRKAWKSSKRVSVLEEIIETEESYIRQLGALIDNVIEPLRTIFLGDESLIAGIFSNVTAILEVSVGLLDSLKTRMDEAADKGHRDARVADVFYYSADYLRHTYIEFSNNLPNSRALVAKTKKSNPRFAKFVKDMTRNKKIGQTLHSFLILPVQRVCRYELLLKNLLECTKPDHKDFDRLGDALDKVRSVVVYVDEHNLSEENMIKLMKIQRSLVNLRQTAVIADPNRYVAYEGDLQLMDSTDDDRGSPVRVFLFNDVMLVCDPHTPQQRKGGAAAGSGAFPTLRGRKRHAAAAGTSQPGSSPSSHAAGGGGGAAATGDAQYHIREWVEIINVVATSSRKGGGPQNAFALAVLDQNKDRPRALTFLAKTPAERSRWVSTIAICKKGELDRRTEKRAAVSAGRGDGKSLIDHFLANHPKEASELQSKNLLHVGVVGKPLVSLFASGSFATSGVARGFSSRTCTAPKALRDALPPTLEATFAHLEGPSALSTKNLFKHARGFKKGAKLGELSGPAGTAQVVASFLVEFLRELPSPLLSPHLLKPAWRALDAPHPEVADVELFVMLHSLSAPNFLVLARLLRTLTTIASHHKENKCSLDVLALTFAPIVCPIAAVAVHEGRVAANQTALDRMEKARRADSSATGQQGAPRAAAKHHRIGPADAAARTARHKLALASAQTNLKEKDVVHVFRALLEAAPRILLVSKDPETTMEDPSSAKDPTATATTYGGKRGGPRLSLRRGSAVDPRRVQSAALVASSTLHSKLIFTLACRPDGTTATRCIALEPTMIPKMLLHEAYCGDYVDPDFIGLLFHCVSYFSTEADLFGELADTYMTLWEGDHSMKDKKRRALGWHGRRRLVVLLVMYEWLRSIASHYRLASERKLSDDGKDARGQECNVPGLVLQFADALRVLPGPAAALLREGSGAPSGGSHDGVGLERDLLAGLQTLAKRISEGPPAKEHAIEAAVHAWAGTDSISPRAAAAAATDAPQASEAPAGEMADCASLPRPGGDERDALHDGGAPVLAGEPPSVRIKGLSAVDFKAQQLAKYMTREAHALLRDVSPLDELIKLHFQDARVAPHFAAMVASFNATGVWAASEILRHHKVQDRVQAASHLMDVCKHLLRLKNFHSLFAVIGGMNHVAVSRLSGTWERVGRARVRRFRYYVELLMPTKNYAKYRATLRITNPPLIPFLGVVTQELTAAEEIPTLVRHIPHQTLVSVEKLRAVYNASQNVKLCASQGYSDGELAIPEQVHENLHAYMKHAMENAMDDETLMEKSKEYQE